MRVLESVECVLFSVGLSEEYLAGRKRAGFLLYIERKRRPPGVQIFDGTECRFEPLYAKTTSSIDITP